MMDFLLFLTTPFGLMCLAILSVSIYMGLKEEKYWTEQRRNDPTYEMTEEERRKYRGIRKG